MHEVQSSFVCLPSFIPLLVAGPSVYFASFNLSPSFIRTSGQSKILLTHTLGVSCHPPVFSRERWSVKWREDVSVTSLFRIHEPWVDRQREREGDIHLFSFTLTSHEQSHSGSLSSFFQVICLPFEFHVWDIIIELHFVVFHQDSSRRSNINCLPSKLDFSFW